MKGLCSNILAMYKLLFTIKIKCFPQIRIFSITLQILIPFKIILFITNKDSLNQIQLIILCLLQIIHQIKIKINHTIQEVEEAEYIMNLLFIYFIFFINAIQN